MKNLFAKHDNTVLIASLAVGSVAAGAAAYLFMTEKGNNMRQQLMERLGFIRNEPINDDNHDDYLNRPHKQPKTDREVLQHHGMITEQPNITN